MMKCSIRILKRKFSPTEVMWLMRLRDEQCFCKALSAELGCYRFCSIGNLCYDKNEKVHFELKQDLWKIFYANILHKQKFDINYKFSNQVFQSFQIKTNGPICTIFFWICNHYQISQNLIASVVSKSWSVNVVDTIFTM